MRSGRLFAGTLDGFRGALDLLVDGVCPMGSVSVSDLATRNLRVIATGVPVGGAVRVAQGTVDYAGASQPADNTATIATLPDTAFVAGAVDLEVGTTSSGFVRTEVLDAAGRVVGISNPIWLLREAPPSGLPAARAC